MDSIFRAARTSLAEKMERHRNKSFLEAMMSATALLAHADREIVLSHRLALDFILENVKELKVFDVHKAVNLFQEYSKAVQQDFNQARERVLKTVAKFSGDQQKATLLVRASEFSDRGERTCIGAAPDLSDLVVTLLLSVYFSLLPENSRSASG